MSMVFSKIWFVVCVVSSGVRVLVIRRFFFGFGYVRYIRVI